MNSHLLSIYERIILETLFIESKSFATLKQELGLKAEVIQSSLNCLVLKSLIQMKQGQYHCKLSKDQFNETVNSKENLKKEINFLQRTSLEQTIDSNKEFLKVRKVFLDYQEKCILKAMLKNLENFLNSTSKRGNLKDQSIIYWSEMPMHELLKTI